MKFKSIFELTTSLMAAKSATHGTPVKSCRTTLAGLKGISNLSFLLNHFSDLR